MSEFDDDQEDTEQQDQKLEEHQGLNFEHLDASTLYFRNLNKVQSLSRKQEIDRLNSLFKKREQIAFGLLKDSKRAYLAYRAIAQLVIGGGSDLHSYFESSGLSKEKRSYLSDGLAELLEGEADFDMLVWSKVSSCFEEVKLVPSSAVRVAAFLLRNGSLDGQFRSLVQGYASEKQEFIESNLRLVVSVSKSYGNAGLSQADIIQEGNIGLIRAVDTYNPFKGKRFSSHATWYIRDAIVRSIQEKSRLIRLPEEVLKTHQAIEKYRNYQLVKFGTEPTEEVLAKELGVSTDVIRQTVKLTSQVVSLDEPASQDDDQVNLAEKVADDTAPNVVDSIQIFRLKRILEVVVSSLSELESAIIRKRFGLASFRIHGYEEIANEYKVSKEKVRRIEKKALGKIRKSDEYELLKDFIADIDDVFS